MTAAINPAGSRLSNAAIRGSRVVPSGAVAGSVTSPIVPISASRILELSEQRQYCFGSRIALGVAYFVGARRRRRVCWLSSAQQRPTLAKAEVTYDVPLPWTLVTFARSERAELCDLLDKVGPHAPTLCEGWDTHDLVAHLWIRETDPVGASGIVAKPLSSLYERRMAEIKQRWEYSELVDRVRRGPARFSIFAIPGVDEGANTTEFFIHHEDVRRAGDSPQTSRHLGDDVEEWMWRRLKLLGRAWFRRVQVGVVLERLGSADADGAPETIRAVSGSSIVTLVGNPSELMLYAHGRTSVAEIKLVGEPDAIEILNSSDLRT
jgi:uncharacterized protein (TIGR03085 family)